MKGKRKGKQFYQRPIPSKRETKCVCVCERVPNKKKTVEKTQSKSIFTQEKSNQYEAKKKHEEKKQSYQIA